MLGSGIVQQRERHAHILFHQDALASGLHWDVLTCGAAELQTHAAAWASLANRALEPDVFFHPDFAIPAARLLPDQQHCLFLFAYCTDEEGARWLGGLLVLEPPRLGRTSVAYSWQHDFACLSGVLLDQEVAPAAMSALLAWIDAELPRAHVVCLQGVRVGGPTATLLAELATRESRPLKCINLHARAIFNASSALGQKAMVGLTAHRRKRNRRHTRSLSELGHVTYTSEGDPQHLVTMSEEFLALELSGWKGRGGTALLSKPETANFATSLFANVKSGLYRIDALRLDGAALAIGVVLRHRDHAYLWKFAYDERYARLSPGVQFVFHLMQAQANDPTLELTDSCAVPDNQMINPIWPDKRPTADVLIGTAAGSAIPFYLSMANLQTLRWARRQLQQLRGSDFAALEKP